MLRRKAGAPVSVADGTGRLYACRVRAAHADHVELAVDFVEEVAPPQPRIVVVHALPRQRKLDDVVQRLSELGIDALVPVHSERSQVRLDAARAAKARDRWRAVARAAAGQSRRARVLEVAEMGEWTTAFPGAARGVVCWEEATTPLHTAAEELVGAAEVHLGIGPEGGLTAEEVAASGLPAVSLGPNVLRTETAALVAAAVLLDRLGRLG